MATVANQTAVVEAYPACAVKAHKVAPLTVRALVKPELADTVREDTYRFCESAACDVVYFSESDPEHRFLRSDLRVRVGQKETEPPIQVCYCFDWTTDDIERELHFTGTTRIPDRIKQKVQQGFCHCETLNPQGICCLGIVNKAVKEARAKLASLPAAGTGESQHNRQAAVVDKTPSVSAREGQAKQKGAFLATLGSLFAAILASACCWLPLLLIAFGFSAAGVGSFFEQYRLHLLCAMFTLLAVAWYLTYRATLLRAWARLTREPAPAGAVEACCATDALPAATDSCCATGKSVGTRFSVRQFNQVMLWIATVVILLFAMFPHWLGLLRGEGVGSSTVPVRADDQQQIVLQIEGMTCEACASTVEQALRSVPGVSAATVSYEKKQATVFLPKGEIVPREALLQAVRKAGYGAGFVEDPGGQALRESPAKQQRGTLHVEGMTKVQGIA
jgi:copper chaperone CopZ